MPSDTAPPDEIERYVREFGEPYRGLIVDALAWLARTEPDWQLTQPIERSAYLRKLIDQQRPPSPT
jgi:hypothetical protein